MYSPCISNPHYGKKKGIQTSYGKNYCFVTMQTKKKTFVILGMPFHCLNPTTGCAPDRRNLGTACLFRYIVQLLQTHQLSSTSDIIRGVRSPSGDRGEESPLTLTWKSMRDTLKLLMLSSQVMDDANMNTLLPSDLVDQALL